MDTLSAFMMGEASRGKPSMVFDWNKAAKIIKENGIKNAEAGLAGDWSYTGGEILVDGEIPEESYTYLSSTWATPQLYYDGMYVDCYIMKDKTDWDSDTFWPDSAKEVLK